MTVKELIEKLQATSDLNNDVLIFERNYLPNGAEVISIEENAFDETIIKVKTIKEIDEDSRYEFEVVEIDYDPLEGIDF